VIRDFMAVAFVQCRWLPNGRIASIENAYGHCEVHGSSPVVELGDSNLLPDYMKV
jgi:hypothetical protein